MVRLHSVMSSRAKMFMLMEFVDGGDLLEHVVKKSNTRLDEDEARKIFQQIICGLEFCHIRGISHRDLKAENILVQGNGQVKISDFGLSVFCDTGDLEVHDQLLHGPNLHHTTCGTMAYLAPEVIKDEGYDGNLADIWSCGVILFFMLTGRTPFENEDRDRE